MYTYVLLITLLTPWCILDHFVRFNNECTYMWYWWHYLHHVVCQINMSELMMNVYSCLADSSTYNWMTMPDLMMNVRTCATTTTTCTMSYLRQLCLLADSGVQHIVCCVCILFVIGVCILSASFCYYRSTLVG